MPYNAAIKEEADYARGLGEIDEDNFHATYNAVLHQWFSTSLGYLIDPTEVDDDGIPEYVVVKHAPGKGNVLIVELKRPSMFNAMGKHQVLDELRDYIEDSFDFTEYDAIYGLGGIGLGWTVCKMMKSGLPEPTIVQNWAVNITSNRCYDLFGTIADSTYNIS